MKFDTISYDKIGERMYVYSHDSGLRAFVIPKKGYFKKNASFATHYGSINSKFKTAGAQKPETVPDGIAHFLEHKLFEQESGNVMDKFGELGASPNAYTGFNQTVYIFSTTDRFTDCLRLLLNFVQNPHITDESVEREKDIIIQEIRMYQDDPGWRVFFNLLNAMYENNPVKIEIAGTPESVSRINRELLYKCYRTFYHPSNMILAAVGDLEPEEVFAVVDECIKEEGYIREVERYFPEREKKISKGYVEQRLDVSMPLFHIGFMDPTAFENGSHLVRHETSIKILLDMLMGRASSFYDSLYSEGLITGKLDMDCNIEKEYGFSIIGGESQYPQRVRDRLAEHLLRLKKDGINRADFERSKKAMAGRFIRQFNSVEKILYAFISVYFKGIYLFDYYDAYDKIDFKDVQDAFDRHFSLENLALSVIKPVQEG